MTACLKTDAKINMRNLVSDEQKNNKQQEYKLYQKDSI